MSVTDVLDRTQPARIVTPVDFPVVWEHPDDTTLCWAHDRMHNPEPLPPLERGFWKRVYEGFNRAAEAYEMPARVAARCINTYLYMALKPAVPPDRMEAQTERAQQKLDATMVRLGAEWDGWWLPEIQSHLAWWDTFDLRGAAMPALLAHLDETLDRALRLWELHFRIVLPSYMAMSQLDDLYQDLFGADEAFGTFRLLQGFDNKTLEAGRALWDLSRHALDSAEIRRSLEEHPAEEVLAEMEKTPAGRAFRDDLRAYVTQYGLRGDKWGLSYPCWIEDPTPVITNLKEYVTSEHPDPRAEQTVQAAEREGALVEIRRRLSPYPRPVVERFEFLLAAAQQGVVLSEDHGFWIDFASTYRVRRVLLEFGRRFAAAEIIARADEVFFLTLEELRESAAAFPSGDRCGVVTEARAEMERFRAVLPPPVLGTDEGPPPDDPIGRFFGKFFGGPPRSAEEPSVLKGNAGSPGTIRGPAKVIRSLSEAGKLRKGDVLVAETTSPSWTPLFATAAAIVTDTGGVLSHCAVVAREYRVPAVVGTGHATAVIRDGQILEVNGDGGVVRICSD
jgi:rifampicin phosphotransferase